MADLPYIDKGIRDQVVRSLRMRSHTRTTFLSQQMAGTSDINTPSYFSPPAANRTDSAHVPIPPRHPKVHRVDLRGFMYCPEVSPKICIISNIRGPDLSIFVRKKRTSSAYNSILSDNPCTHVFAHLYVPMQPRAPLPGQINMGTGGNPALSPAV